jgi:hypothetical protein
MGVFGAANGYDPLQAPYKIRIANSEGVAALGTATISLDAPTITGLSNNNLLTSATGSQVITLTGTGFTSSMTGTDKVLVLGADGSTLYTVDSVTIVSSTSLTFKLSATGVVLSSAQLANKPYKVRITGIFGNTVTGTDTINLLPPTITSLSNNTLTDGTAGVTGSHIITVTGTGFTSSMTGTDKVQVLGVDGTTLYSVDSVTIDSLTSLTFKLSATGVAIPSPQLANRPYKVKLTGNAGLTVTSTQTIGFTGLSWTSPAAGATLATFNSGTSANNTELDATDDVGGSGVTFSVPANNLPSGLTLNGSTGAITGQIAVGGTMSVTFRVTDNVTGTFAERTFSIVGVLSLYPFTSPFTFTNAGVYGRTGPTLSQLQSPSSGYGTTGTTTWVGSSNFFNVTNTGIQKWTVPTTKTYRIAAYGAGSWVTNNGGRGARITGTCTLTQGEVIYILVGQTCVNQTQSSYHGGAGGSFVVRAPYNTNASIIVIAGGAGGGHTQNSVIALGNGSLNTSGNSGNLNVSGGSSGNGGTSGASNNQGAGFFNGPVQNMAFVSGGLGGGSASGYEQGGFGGGGRHGNSHGGGGGGYSGGGGSAASPYTGGGGGSYKASFFTTESQDNTIHDGPGSVTITEL